MRHIIMTPEEEGGYSVSVPSLPGCFSQGETIEEAIMNIREAIELYIESMVEHGEAVPDDVEVQVIRI
jgi:antitoxin HicB